jgi:DNA repair exonuclease SbcCD ATPase subunit
MKPAKKTFNPLLISGIIVVVAVAFFLLPKQIFSRNLNSEIPNTGNIQNKPYRDQTNPGGESEDTQQGPGGNETSQQNKAEIKERACEQLQKRIQNRVQLFEKNREQHQERYTNLQGRLQEAANKLEARNFNTTQLQTSINTLNQLITTYDEEYSQFIELLDASSNHTCSELGGQYRQSFQSSRGQLIKAREARYAIWTFYKNTIREDIKDLRDQIVDDSSV